MRRRTKNKADAANASSAMTPIQGDAATAIPSIIPPKARKPSRIIEMDPTASFTPTPGGPALARVAQTRAQNLKTSEPHKTPQNPPKDTTIQPKKKQKNMTWKTSWMTKDAGELIQAIPLASIQPATVTVSSESGFEDLCSYNWQENGTIVVPGEPPKWTPPPLPITLSPDSGHQFVDQNAFRMPKFPFEPAFQALSIAMPEAKLDDIDIILNRNSLRKFLDFAAGRRRDPWRMDLHMVNDTLFVSRKEMNARAMVRGNGNSGYGHNFEKAFTKPGQGLQNSSSHHRLIRYRLGTLECVVRFEVDAYYEDPDRSNPEDSTQQMLDQIAATVAQLSINEAQPNTLKKGGTQVLRKGNPIDPSKLAEIKTRKNVNINDALPQLWFGRTPYLLTGKHDKGVFRSIDYSHVQSKFADWEKIHQEPLRKMVSALVELKRIMKDSGLRAAILVCDKGGPLQLFKMKSATDVLPKDMIVKYWGSGKET